MSSSSTPSAIADGTPIADEAVLVADPDAIFFPRVVSDPGGGLTIVWANGVEDASCVEFLYDTQAALLVWDMQDAPAADQGLDNPKGLPVPMAPLALTELLAQRAPTPPCPVPKAPRVRKGLPVLLRAFEALVERWPGTILQRPSSRVSTHVARDIGG